MPAVRLRSWWASLTTAFPFSSSSPTLRRPTPGVGRPITSRAYTEPRWPKPTSSRASQSTLAPPSRTSTDFPAVGNAAPMAARCTPGCNRTIRVAPPIAAGATRITSGVLDRHPVFVLVVAAGGAHPVRPLQVAAPWAGLERGPLRLVVRAAQPLLALRCPSLGYRHGDPRLVAELPLQRGERCPARIRRRGRAAAGARVQVLSAPRAQPAAVRPALQVLRDGEQQVLPDRRREVDHRRLGWQGIGIRILQRVGVLREQHPAVRRHDAADGGEAAAALSPVTGAERAVPIETPVTGCLQAPGDRDGVGERDRHALEERVGPGELGLGF